MNFRSPEALIRVNVADAAQHALVKEQSFDPRPPPANSLRKFLAAHFERIGPESCQFLRKRHFRQISDPPETPRIRVSQFTAVVEQQAYVWGFFPRLLRTAQRNPSCPPKCHDQERWSP